jgi:putative hydrolase of HD superfamily
MPDDDRLRRQIEFLIEIDKLKGVFRQTWLMDGSRRENDAEHSWHLALLAVLLSEYAAEPDVDLFRVVKMVLVHDLVEIDAGDVLVYDRGKSAEWQVREREAAERIYRILPADQADELRALWEEFEARATPEARFAAALDRLQPILHNYQTEGKLWQEHGVTSDQVIAHNRHMAEGAPRLWQYAHDLIRDAVNRGHLES